MVITGAFKPVKIKKGKVVGISIETFTEKIWVVNLKRKFKRHQYPDSKEILYIVQRKSIKVHLLHQQKVKHLLLITQ